MTNEQNKTMSEEVEVNETAELTDEKTVEAVFEEEVSNASDTTENSVEELQAEIDSLKSKLTEAENRYLRLHADFDNYRRRTRLEQEANEKYRSQKLIIDLLPAIDNFERALKMEAENEQNKSLLQGMDMVYRGLLEALKKEGVEPIEAVGAEFDPHKHQAVMQGEDANYGSNIVTDEFQKGYVLKDRVIRPSMVKVNQ